MGGQPPSGQPMGQPNNNPFMGGPPPGMGTPPNNAMGGPPMANPNMPPPPMGSPAQPNALSTQINGFGGSASGRLKFKNALGTRKNNFLQSQQRQAQMQPPMQPPMQQPIAPIGRMVGNDASVGSNPVPMMNGGVVPLFNGIGRY